MLQSEKDALILDAAIEFGPDYLYEIRNGTLGLTLYIDAPSRAWATPIRQAVPGNWRGLYVVVLYTYDEDEPQLPYNSPLLKKEKEEPV